MSEDELKAIEARVKREDDNGYEFHEAARDDVTALVAEVRQLQGARMTNPKTTLEELHEARVEVARVTEAATVAYEVAESERKELEARLDVASETAQRVIAERDTVQADLAEAQSACVELQEEKDALVTAAHNLAGLFRALHENHAEWADYRAVIDLCARHGVKQHPLDRVWKQAPAMYELLRAFVHEFDESDPTKTTWTGNTPANVEAARIILAAVEGAP